MLLEHTYSSDFEVHVPTAHIMVVLYYSRLVSQKKKKKSIIILKVIKHFEA